MIYSVTVEKKQLIGMEIEADSLTKAVEQVENFISEQDPEFGYDYAICDEDEKTLLDWS